MKDKAKYFGISCKVVETFWHTNPDLGKKKISLIFYFGKRHKDAIDKKGIFRYVDDNDLERLDEEFPVKLNKYELFMKYGQFFIEDALYNFVNYDGLKV